MPIDTYAAAIATGADERRHDCALRAAALAARGERDVAINAESRTYWDADVLVSLLSVHTLVCPLIRAELRDERSVRVVAYYHADTRLGLRADEATLRDTPAAQDALGLRAFVRRTLARGDDLPARLHDPAVREMYLHEVIRHLAHPIAACRLASDDLFTVTSII